MENHPNRRASQYTADWLQSSIYFDIVMYKVNKIGPQRSARGTSAQRKSDLFLALYQIVRLRGECEISRRMILCGYILYKYEPYFEGEKVSVVRENNILHPI